MRPSLLAFAAASVLAIVAGHATADSIVTLNDVGQGWINQGGTTDGNSQIGNYLAGNCAATNCTTSGGGESRNFFQFSIPTLGAPVLSASLLLHTSLVVVGQGPMMDLTLTSTSALTFAQLGNGTVYATRTYSASDGGFLVPINLNAAALADISADAGGTFTISGRISSGATFDPNLPNQFLFGQSQGYITQLSITLGLLQWLPIAYPGNAADYPANCFAGNCGSVAYLYDISKYAITNWLYVQFLNAKATSDPLGLYNPAMGSDANNGGITQSGVSGSFSYAAKPGFENKPVTYASFYSALRFANWVNNGQGSGDTETGSYTLLGGTPIPSNGTTVTRNPGAKIFLPSESEWYKAAYFSPGGVYFAYPFGTNTEPACAVPSATPNTANCNSAVGHVTDVGAYTGSQSPFGTFDQGGNIVEWTDTIVGGPSVVQRGAAWSYPADSLAAGTLESLSGSSSGSTIGFRLAAPDSDGDGIPDRFDNCPFTPNGSLLGTCLGTFPQGQAICHANSDCVSNICSLNQEDTGGVGVVSPPDGIGDACQCGDVNNDGVVTSVDATILKRSAVHLSPYTSVTLMPGFAKCDVNANGTCDTIDASIISRSTVHLPPGIVQGCHAATTFP